LRTTKYWYFITKEKDPLNPGMEFDIMVNILLHFMLQSGRLSKSIWIVNTDYLPYGGTCSKGVIYKEYKYTLYPYSDIPKMNLWFVLS
jgi:hypothetical protein